MDTVALNPGAADIAVLSLATVHVVAVIEKCAATDEAVVENETVTCIAWAMRAADKLGLLDRGLDAFLVKHWKAAEEIELQNSINYNINYN